MARDVPFSGLGLMPAPRAPLDAERLFVGREPAMSTLSAALSEAQRSQRGSILLITGEPGVGKTRLADEFGSYARDRGARVLSGRCPEHHGAPAFWPWVQVIREFVSGSDVEELNLGASEIEPIRHLLPNRDPTQPIPPPDAMDSENARFRFFDSVTLFLKEASRAQPLVLLLDDLHWADKSSLLLFQFLAREVGDFPILVIGTYRDYEVADDNPLVTVVQDPLCREIPLRGIGPDEVALLAQSIAKSRVSSEIVARIHRETEGNPFFVGEIVRLMLTEGQLDLPAGTDKIALPRGVRQVIGKRIRDLSQPCLELLRTASVIGREFSVPLLERVSRVPVESLLETLDEARHAHVLSTTDSVQGNFRFAHALLREVLYDGLATAKRLRLHRSIAEAMENDRNADCNESNLGELAFHFFQAAAFGDAEKAIDYSRRAGDAAVRMLAFEDAIRHYERALEALNLRPGIPDSMHCEIWVKLGNACIMASEPDRARSSFLQAAELSDRIDAAEIHARACFGLSEVTFEYGRIDDRVLNHLESGLAAVGDADSPLRARLLARLSVELCHTRDHRRFLPLSSESIAMARRTGDPGALAYALLKRQWIPFDPEQAQDRLERADEVVEMAYRAGDRALDLEGRIWRIVTLVNLGDIASVDTELEIFEERARAYKQPRFLWRLVRLWALRALMDGRFEEAEALATEAFQTGRDHAGNAAPAFWIQITQLRLQQGRSSEVLASVDKITERYPNVIPWRCALAHLYIIAGRTESARLEFERIVNTNLDELLQAPSGLISIAYLSEVAFQLKDLERASKLYALMLPYRDLNVETGLGVAAIGSTEHYLGLLATALEHWDAADTHFTRALESNTRMGAWPWVAHTQYSYATMLKGRGHAGDSEKARMLRDRCIESARSLGMKDLLARAESIEFETVETPSVRVETGEFKQHGDFWTISYSDLEFRLKDQLGLRYIAHLLNTPGTEVHSAELLAAGRGEPRRVAPEAHGEPVLDRKAQLAYRGRAETLREELEQAKDFNDIGRMERIREELNFIRDELSRSIGLGGQSRRMGSAGERARVSVTRTIKSALGKISIHHPELGAHLQATLRTGTFACYNPDPRIPVTWLT